MQNTLKNNNYFYRDKGEVYEKWSFIKKQKTTNIFNFIIPVFIVSSVFLMIT
jgi:hypothetical protein